MIIETLNEMKIATWAHGVINVCDYWFKAETHEITKHKRLD